MREKDKHHLMDGVEYTLTGRLDPPGPSATEIQVAADIAKRVEKALIHSVLYGAGPKGIQAAITAANKTSITLAEIDAMLRRFRAQFDRDASEEGLNYPLHNYDLCNALSADIAAMFGAIPVRVQMVEATFPTDDDVVIQVIGEDGNVRWSFDVRIPRVGGTKHIYRRKLSNREYSELSEHILFTMWKDLSEDDEDE